MDFMDTLVNVLSVGLLVLGFGFVVFWHELGHFLAAKAVGIRVEQFAVGFGQALLCWRKGIGVTVGTSAPQYEKKIHEAWERKNHEIGTTGEIESKDGFEAGPDAASKVRIARELGLGETEYRLNWIPLGGYVKMLGQDDLDPTVKETDPRAYNNKPIPARMLVVVAGVVMNIILAAMLFMGLFMYGFRVAPPLVGGVLPGSPAQEAGIQVGDRIVEIDGNAIQDFNKIALNTALLREGSEVPVRVLRDGKEVDLKVTPRKARGEAKAFLQLGVMGTPAMRGVAADSTIEAQDPALQVMPDLMTLKPGDEIVAVDGKPIEPEYRKKDEATPSSYALLYRALQDSPDASVRIRMRDSKGTERDEVIRGTLIGDFDGESASVAGMRGRPMVARVSDGSPVLGKLLPGDTVLRVEYDDTKTPVLVNSSEEWVTEVLKAGAEARPIRLLVERAGTQVEVGPVVPTVKIPRGRGLGVVPREDFRSPVVGVVEKESAAARAGIEPGARILSVNGQSVRDLLDVRRKLMEATAGASKPVEILVQQPGGAEAHLQLSLEPTEAKELAMSRLLPVATFDERIEPRRTSNPLRALKWGVVETRDLVLQGYITIKRMFQGSVAASNLTGPLGIFHAGGMIATTKGMDWTVWFLAMISANLAVVNFLPIPIVDGGLFLFLVIEKLMGRPLSPRAQSIAQIVGLGLIAGVFVFVTYNDIARML